MKLILGRRPPCFYLCDHFSLDCREFLGDRSSHETFLWRQYRQLPLNSTSTSDRAASASIVVSLVAWALELVAQSGLAVFPTAGDAMRLRKQGSNRWRSRQRTSGGSDSSTSQMGMCWGELRKTIARSDAGAWPGNTCNSHGHVSSLGLSTGRCNVTPGTRGTIMSARAIVLSSNEKTTAHALCQGNHRPVSYWKHLRYDMELCTDSHRVLALGTIRGGGLRSTKALFDEQGNYRRPASPNCLPFATDSW
jgi:hypothetical protein